MLISDDYRAANIELHERHEHFGASSARHAPLVRDLFLSEECRSILDYGCGKGLLGATLPDLPILEYDPAIIGKDSEPAPADLVVCTDVLEHIEPECLENVLFHLRCLTRKILFGLVSTRLAHKFLADGRNAHLIVETADWWQWRLGPYFLIEEWVTDNDDEVNFLARPISLGTRFPGEIFIP